MSSTTHTLRFLYSVLFYALLPLVLLRLLWRGIKAPAYWSRWNERFAYYSTTHYSSDVLWFHAVSVGEAEALFPLIQLIQQQNPTVKLLVTTTTPTGSARVKAVLQNSVDHVYLPYDVPSIIKRFMTRFKPVVAVIMETEIWPNMFFYCKKHNIPLYIVNARLSERSTRRYQKLALLMKPVLAQAHILSQSQQDTERFIAIGANPAQVQTVGNLKFDVDIPQQTIEYGQLLKKTIFKQRFVWLIASTHPGEEELFLNLYPGLKANMPDLLLLLVPRHPERFLEVKKLAEQHQLQTVMRTSNLEISQHTDIYVLDTIGELKMFYAVADVAFVAGSMVPVGGHNILEAAAVGIPIMFGPFMTNFTAIAEAALNAKAAVQCQNKNQLIETISILYNQPSSRSTLAANGKAFVNNNKGIKQKICQRLLEHFTPATPS